ncbi:hypothetical protein KC343_g2966 [Hortaea werneckii]|nr:hypothetical protein KC352_g8952 [Hortaea werneckii]KAI7569315.1 hypothetical protein KC317_g3444 [Hortaea werneckii]KAI7620565.1 hypothetical protein KC346_g4038 [Hortaea werneckii]KAI7633412.1 hypothetical protein KC343_g2966 [Hortaea werneckii]KAI7678985.1 hypothetical protein KC319_g3007 [Hortaea werneckii]
MADRLLTTNSHQDNERLRQPNSERALAILLDINSRVEAIQTATTQINQDLAKLRDTLSPQPTSEPDIRPICSIDLEPIDSEEAEALLCGHVFHSACIATWLRQSNTCPIDRSTIPNGNEQQQQEPPYELSADPLQITIPGAFPSDTAEDSQSSPLPSADQHDWDTTRPSTRATSTPSATLETTPILHRTLLFRLILELEYLRYRARRQVARQVEVDFNRAWMEFLQTECETLCARMRGI